MNHSTQNVVHEKPLIPSLFQIAACADDVKSVSALKGALAHHRARLPETMLSVERIEAVLKALAQKKRPGASRGTAGRLDK